MQPTRRPLVVFTDDTIRPEAAALLAGTCDVRTLDAYPAERELAAACVDATAILARLGTVTAGVIAAASGRIVSSVKTTSGRRVGCMRK